MLSRLVNFFLLSKEQKNFVNNNKKIFNYFSDKEKKSSKILVEFNNWKPFHVSNSFLLNYLIKKYDAEAISYEIFRNLHKEKSYFQILKWYLGNYFNLKTFYIYRSFNVKKFIRPKFSRKVYQLAQKEFIKNIVLLKKKSNIEKLVVNNIWIGDIFYDSYLKKFDKITIDINSENLGNYFKEFLCIFFFWYEYIKENDVKAVLSSHGVYSFAIPLRIASYLKLDAFVANEQKIYRYRKNDISFKKNLTGNFSEYRFFKSTYESFGKQKKRDILKNGLNISKKISKKSQKLFYLNDEKIFKTKNIHKSLLKKKNLRVLISAHAFLDSPHAFGRHLFEDFSEWFKFLGKIINKTNYEWFIKPHPNKDETSIKAIYKFVNDNPKVKLINSHYNINHISKMKIDFALTIFGVVAREYPLRKINVINASKVNPHNLHNFSYTCENIKQYEKVLLNLRKFKYFPNKKDLNLYHYMNDKYFNRNYLFKDFDKEVSKAKGIKNFYNNNFYKRWLNYSNQMINKRIFNNIKNFEKSNDYAMSLKHQTDSNDNK